MIPRWCMMIWLALVCTMAHAQYLRDGGTSTSGTDGTKLAEVEAASGYELVNILALSGHTNVADTGHRLVVTYHTGSPLTQTPSTAGQRSMVCNDAGVIELNTGRHTAHSARDTARRITKVRLETAGSGTGQKSGFISALQVPEGAGPVMHRAGGTSTATSPTVFASITAATGKVLTRWTALAAHTNTASTAVTLRVTYTDDTTDSATTTVASNGHIIANPAGLMVTADNGFVSLTPLATDKSVKKIEALTSGSGSGTRSAVLAAVEADGDTGRVIQIASTTSGGITLVDQSAASGKRLVAFSCFAAQTAASGNSMTMFLHDDSSSASLSSTVNAARVIDANWGGMLLMNGATGQAALSADLKRARVTTTGNGATRAAILAAVEESLASGAAVKMNLARRKREWTR